MFATLLARLRTRPASAPGPAGCDFDDDETIVIRPGEPAAVTAPGPPRRTPAFAEDGPAPWEMETIRDGPWPEGGIEATWRDR